MKKQTRNNIAQEIISGNTKGVLDKISEAIYWAWNNWSDSDTEAWWEEQTKPVDPTETFIEDWCDDNDWECDGYDVDELEKLFG